jgi:hypothetical protein
MIANMISLFISQWLQHEPIYEGLAQQDGIHLPTIRTRAETEQRKVPSIMRPALEVMSAEMRIDAALSQAAVSTGRA